ncbi:MAG: cell division protein ZipA C-terminal FtsZ-binding domain-containing protein [Rhodospirillaceae bacterium]|nr:cell division protein ZipA C-terminal FtsZ-binding domain-containing protein [Rhodospirillaceae bacterium]MDE0363711.1 cell division protein ZipA C-terminal FtsZ-binding domain-containing protein [Rhodospirillaceae bacterium]
MTWSELELRWVLLGLGLLVVLGVFLGGLIKSRSRPSETPRSEPVAWPEDPEKSVPATESIKAQEGFPAGFEGGGGSPEAAVGETRSGSDTDGQVGEPQPEESQPEESQVAPGTADPVPETKRVLSLRLVPGEGERLDAERTARALQEAGLQHGPYEIFHFCEDRNVPESGFSVANLVEPGSFDLSSIPGTTLPGITFFMVLPGSGDPVERFDKMTGVARDLCQSLNARLLDELGNSWSIQGERYHREELIEYRRRHSGI